MKIAKMEKYNKKRQQRTVIITQGPQPTILAIASTNKKAKFIYKEIEVPLISGNKVVDTNGAGDTFVGAFFAELARGKGVSDAIKGGHELSSKVIKNIGVQFN